MSVWKNSIIMEKKSGDKEETKELTAEEKEVLKRLEKGELEVPVAQQAARADINKDPKYKVYSEQMYEVDSKLGLIYRHTELIAKQRRVLLYMLKTIGSNLMHGKSIMNVSLPVSIFDKETLLQRAAKDFVLVPDYLEKMYATPDPIEKMKIAVTFIVASLHYNIGQEKPFNPIWGETYQCSIGDVSVACEQTSHHPPVARLLLTSEHYRMELSQEFSLSTYPNSLAFACVGYKKIVFNDPAHTTYKISFPWSEATGVMFGTRYMTYKGNINIKDKTNKLYAQLRLCAGGRSFVEGVYKQQDVRNDFFKGFITNNKALLKDLTRKAFYSRDMISYIEGQWIDFLKIDGDLCWTIGQERAFPVIPHPDPLPSDSRFRTDLIAFLTSSEENAQREKEIMEEIQRNDRKLRAAFPTPK